MLHEQAAPVNLPRAWGTASLASLDPGQILEVVSSDASTSSSGYSVFVSVNDLFGQVMEREPFKSTDVYKLNLSLQNMPL